MTTPQYLLASFAIAVIVACALVFGMGYYESAGLAVDQFAFIVLPIFLPLAVLTGGGRVRGIGIAVVAAILTVGWGSMVYIDLTADPGGGATFAVLAGWGASALALVVAALFAIVARFLPRRIAASQ